MLVMGLRIVSIKIGVDPNIGIDENLIGHAIHLY
jgi:hypothetical protein